MTNNNEKRELKIYTFITILITFNFFNSVTVSYLLISCDN